MLVKASMEESICSLRGLHTCDWGSWMEVHRSEWGRRMSLCGRTLRHMGVTLLRRTHYPPLLNLSDLLLLAKHDFHQMSRHLKFCITAISCFCDTFTICILEASVGLRELSSTSRVTSVMVFFPFIQMFCPVIHPQIYGFSSSRTPPWYAGILHHHVCSISSN